MRCGKWALLASRGVAERFRWTARATACSVKRYGVILVLVLAAGLCVSANASDRKFTYVYEATTAPKGTFEFEQWVTWKTSKKNDSDFDRLDFRHELEWGITDRFQVALYLADWRYQDGESVSNDRVQYRSTSVELKYNLTNPITDPIGMALYGEIKGGDQLFELEGKIILQKDIGPWTLAYNATIEAEWEEDDFSKDKGKFEQTAGISYQFSPKFLMGVEFLHEVEFDDWDKTGDSVVYLGPNVSYRSKKWWVTLTPLFQVTGVDSEADFQTRMIFGMHF